VRAWSYRPSSTASLTTGCRPTASARDLTKMLARDGRLLPSRCWPNLKVLASWKGPGVNSFIEKCKGWYDGIPTRDVGYGSSEFRTGLVLSDEGSRNIPLPDNYFYEFIPFDDAEPYRSGAKRPLLLHQVEQGQKYYLVQTGMQGLYRYQVQDIVAINGSYQQTPTFEFVQKASIFASIDGERMYEFQVNEAIARLGSEVPELAPKFFIAYADAEERRYLVVAEFATPPALDAQARFCTLLDHALRDANPGYAAARDEGRLQAPRLHLLTRGQGEQYVQWVSTRALYDMQAKIHRLKADYSDDFAYFAITPQPV
ncbi:MAG: GH3 domain-containing protein, partial [Dehalococcoidia bacterium]